MQTGQWQFSPLWNALILQIKSRGEEAMAMPGNGAALLVEPVIL